MLRKVDTLHLSIAYKIRYFLFLNLFNANNISKLKQTSSAVLLSLTKYNKKLLLVTLFGYRQCVIYSSSLTTMRKDIDRTVNESCFFFGKAQDIIVLEPT